MLAFSMHFVFVKFLIEGFPRQGLLIIGGGQCQHSILMKAEDQQHSEHTYSLCIVNFKCACSNHVLYV